MVPYTRRGNQDQEHFVSGTFWFHFDMHFVLFVCVQKGIGKNISRPLKMPTTHLIGDDNEEASKLVSDICSLVNSSFVCDTISNPREFICNRLVPCNDKHPYLADTCLWYSVADMKKSISKNRLQVRSKKVCTELPWIVVTHRNVNEPGLTHVYAGHKVFLHKHTIGRYSNK